MSTDSPQAELSRPDPLEPLVSSFQHATREAVDRWFDGLAAEVADPLIDEMQSLARLADELVEEVEGGECETARLRLREEVIKPAITLLSDLQVGRTLEQRFGKLLDDLRPVDTLPEEVVRQEPAALFEPEEGDSLLRRARKRRVRAGRRSRSMRRAVRNGMRFVVRRPRIEAPVEEQAVPLRQLASHHRRRRLPAALEPVQEEVQQCLARPLARFVTALTEALDLLLERERGGKEAAELFPELCGSLAEWTEVEGLADLRADAHRAVEEAEAAFERDLYRSGTFMQDRAVLAEEVEERSERSAWATWHHRLLGRLMLDEALLEIRQRTQEMEDGFAEMVRDEAVAAVLDALHSGESVLRERAEEARQLFAEDGAPDQLEAGIRRLLSETLASVEQEVAAFFEAEAPAARVRKAYVPVGEALEELTARLPADLQVVERDETSPERLDPTETGRAVRLQRIAHRAYDVLFVEGLRAAAEPMAQVVAEARKQVDGAPTVLRFNLESAIEELVREEGEPEEHLEAARELVVDGITRSADLLEEQREKLDAAGVPFEEKTETLFDEAFEQLHDQLRLDEPLQERLVDIRARIAERAREVAALTGRQFERGRVLGQRAWQHGRQRGLRLLRRGQTAAGLITADQVEAQETVDTLSEIHLLLERKPIVYRRLFTFQPVTDPTLLEGRDEDLRAVRRSYERWQRGLTNPLLLTGYNGSGLTSFLNVLRGTLFEEADVRSLTLTRRVRTERAAAEALAELLGEEKEGLGDLDDLAARVLSGDPPGKPQVCFIERLEHLYQRQVGGLSLLDRVLTFFSQVDSRIFVVGTISDYGWQIAERTERSATPIVRRHALLPIDRDDLQAIIENRHLRSGLPLRFEAREGLTSSFLRRRLRKAKTEEERQELLRTDYFDRLYRVSGQNIMLALFYWLRSAEVREETLYVRPVEPLSFAFLQSFDMMRAFTLKAFLEHATLTVAEHSEIFRVPLQTSIQIFEMLGNLLLIAPAGEEGQAMRFDFATVDPSLRYRIRPLLVHPVIQFLRGKNVLH